MTGRLSRRELAVLLGGLWWSSTGSATADEGFPLRRPGRVGLATLTADDSGVVTSRGAEVAVGAALVAATGSADAKTAIRALFRPTDVVGIKLNCLGGPRLSPRSEIVAALVELLTAGGLGLDRIILFERSSRELERAGFQVRRGGEGLQCYGTDNDYDREPSVSGSIGSCYARLVSEKCTALISFGVVKDHDLAGVSASLKNWYGVIHNPNKYHDNQCDPYVADVVRHPFIASKLRLTVLDGVVAQCHGGPAYRPDATFPLGRVAVSTDPVAADLWAWKVIDAERVSRGMATLEGAGRSPKFIATAARHGLGVGDPAGLIEVEA